MAIKMKWLIITSVIITNAVLTSYAFAVEYYVAPTGSASGTGAITSPWNLATALSGASGKVKPGDIINLRGGTYTGLFTSTLTGTAALPIVVRSYPGEWAIVDGAPFSTDTNVTLQVNGQYTWYRDFEVMNSNTNRPEVFPFRPPAVNVYGPNTKFINMLIHDGGQGIGLWDPAYNTEVHGCIIYNNGGEYRDHGIYTQNSQAGTGKEISNNVLFNNFGYALHIYGSGSTPLLGYAINDNTIVNDKSLIGNRPVQNMTFKNNSLYNAAFNFGYNSPYNVNGLIENNWFASPLINFMGWKGLTVKNNKFWKTGDKAGGLVNVTYYDGYATTDFTFTGNIYHQFDESETIDYWISFPTVSKGFKFSVDSFGPPAEGAWQDDLKYDLDGTYVLHRPGGHPTGLEVFIRPNKYEAGRAIISVYNWDNSDEVSVDISSLFVTGEQYELHNAQNYKNQVITGVYKKDKPIIINMKYFSGTTPWSVASPVGTVPSMTDRPLSFPEFGVFIIKKAPANTAVVKGDLSGDGFVTVYDASLVAQAAVGIKTLTSSQQSVADVSGDGVVTVYDAVLIVKYAIGLTSQL